MKQFLLSLCMLLALQVIYPQVEAKTRTVEITIQEPQNNGGSPVRGYEVEMRKPESSKWIPITGKFIWPYVRRVFTYKYTADFEPARYEFRTFAVTDKGKGKPSDIDYVIFRGDDDLTQGVVLICGDCPSIKCSMRKDFSTSFAWERSIPEDDVQIPYRHKD